MDSNQQNNHNHGEKTPCMMCSLHHMVHGKSLCNICGGANHFSLARIILGLLIIAMTLWIGIEIGGALGVDRDYRYGMDSGYSHQRMIMRGGYDNYAPDTYAAPARRLVAPIAPSQE